jgi:hypothetical protein
MGNGLPAGVFDATVIVPSGFIVNGPFGVRRYKLLVLAVRLRFELHLNVSLPITLGVLVPVYLDYLLQRILSLNLLQY